MANAELTGDTHEPRHKEMNMIEQSQNEASGVRVE
jgi:hypothetical protein